MAQQTFVNYFVPAEVRELVRQDLVADGFAVTVGQRAGSPVLVVRVRRESDDKARVEKLVRRLAPEASNAPESAPTMHLKGYREGRR